MRDDAEAGGWMIDQVRPEPCDQTVELSLAPGGRLLFLSDLHVTERGPLADFQARDALRELVESLGEHPGRWSWRWAATCRTCSSWADRRDHRLPRRQPRRRAGVARPRASFTELDGGKLAVDSGCWIRALMPVRAWLGLPPVFAPAYPCAWVEVDTSLEGVRVALWQRDVEIRRRLNLAERLLARRPLPQVAPSPPRVLRGTTLAYAATRPPVAAGAD
jgi:hypothetical protein